MRAFRLAMMLVVCLLLHALYSVWTPVAAQTTDKAAILTALNRVRLAGGVAPLALNPALENAAQLHSIEMATAGSIDLAGKRGSSALERITAVSYPAWRQTRIWAENVFAGNHGFDEALAFLLKNEEPDHSPMSARFREVGIGAQIALNSAGEQITYWTLTFGSQPNVLPVFINDGATAVMSQQIAVHFTQEEAVPSGEGTTMGTVIEVRMSMNPSFQGALWQRWESLIPFTFDPQPGPKTVYVQMRDAGGRTASATASVLYDPNGTPQPAVVAEKSSTDSGATLNGSRVSATTPARTAVPILTLPPEALPGQDGVNRAGSAATKIVLRTPFPHSDTRQNPDSVATEAGTDWLLPTYLVVQAALVITGIYWFLSLKKSSRI